MKTILLTFDTEEFDLPKEYNQEITKEAMYSIAENGLQRVMHLLKKHDIPATFFTTANFAQKFQEIIKDLAKTHELASHGFSHTIPLTPQTILQAREILNNISNKSIKGFRAPRWNIKNLTMVKQAGFLYDSSTHPIFLPHRYNNLHQKTYIHKINGLTEIPQSTLPPNFSLFWLAFKNFPLTYAKLFTKINFLKSNYTMLTFHPWEFANLEKIKIPRFIKSPDSFQLLDKLEKYIIFCKENKYKFQRVHEFLEFLEISNIV